MKVYTNLKASKTLILICYENFKNKVSPVNPNTEKLFDIIIYPSGMYVYAGFSKISQLSNLTVHHSQTTGQLIWKNDLIAIFKKKLLREGCSSTFTLIQ